MALDQPIYHRYTLVETYEDELIVFAVEVIEVISPQVFSVSRIDKAMAVWRGFDKHVRWQILVSSISVWFTLYCRSYIHQDTSLLESQPSQSVGLQRAASSNLLLSSRSQSWSKSLQF